MAVIVTNQIPNDVSVTDGTHTVSTVTEIFVQNATVSNAGNGTANVDGLAPLSSPTFTGTITVPELTVSGLTGATAPSRYVGATTSGAPTTGTFAVGDFVIDQSGAVWVCTTAGTPGTWTKIGGGMNYALFTASGTWTVPAGVTTIRCRAIGGGGGGGAGDNTGSNGGSGAGAGLVIDQSLAVTPGGSLTITVGSAGVGGTTSGAYGTTGGTTTVANGATTLISAPGGERGPAASASSFEAGLYGTTAGWNGTNNFAVGVGGVGTGNGYQSGVPMLCVVGGGGGGSAGTNGGGGGGSQQSGSPLAMQNGGGTGANSSVNGGNAANATMPGCGGGGGGSPASGGTIGAGGNGAPGQVEIWY